MKHIFGKKSGQSGFSLVELMIVVGIIGVLATLALPRFKQFQAKAKMSEAMSVMSHVYTLEQSYSLDNNSFAAVTLLGASTATAAGGNTCTDTGAVAIGFYIDPCVSSAPTPRFAYSVVLTSGGGFQATAATGAAAANRVCSNNGAFNVTLTDKNVSSVPSIGSACPN